MAATHTPARRVRRPSSARSETPTSQAQSHAGNCSHNPRNSPDPRGSKAKQKQKQQQNTNIAGARDYGFVSLLRRDGSGNIVRPSRTEDDRFPAGWDTWEPGISGSIGDAMMHACTSPTKRVSTDGACSELGPLADQCPASRQQPPLLRHLVKMERRMTSRVATTSFIALSILCLMRWLGTFAQDAQRIDISKKRPTRSQDGGAKLSHSMLMTIDGQLPKVGGNEKADAETRCSGRCTACIVRNKRTLHRSVRAIRIRD